MTTCVPHVRTTPCRRSFWIVPLFLTALLLSLQTWHSTSSIPFDQAGFVNPESLFHEYAPGYLKPSKLDEDILQAQNRTLGFQEIKVISLPKRTDKQDAWAVTSSITGFDYQVIQGVEIDSPTISDKSLPHTMSQRPKAMACWRAHMNVLQHMVERSVASTLIFEDDADWDVSLKSQLTQFARGSRWLLNRTSSSSAPGSRSPYGEGWDMLWLGHCGGNPKAEDPRRFVIPNDPTVEPLSVRGDGEHIQLKPHEIVALPDLQSRTVAPQNDAICTASYAISLQGARKALYHLSMLPFNDPVDLGYGDMCRNGSSGFTCIAPFPRLIGVHRPAGNVSRWSDIEIFGNEVREAHSEGLVFSTRLNLDRLLNGERVLKSSEVVAKITGVHEMDIDQIGSAIGHGEIIMTEVEDGIESII